MSIQALQSYTLYSKYAKYLPEKTRREVWPEQVQRVKQMHETKLGPEKIQSIQEDWDFAFDAFQSRKVLGSQRALQFGGQGILNKEARIYNCTVSYCDRPRFFQECMWLLLCGAGVGFSVQTHHVAKLPNIAPRTKGKKKYVIPDTIEGWSDALGVLMSSYFTDEGGDPKTDAGNRIPHLKETTGNDLQSHVPFPEYQGYTIEFDFSQIRPKGSRISWGGKAPGPEGLEQALILIEKRFQRLVEYTDRLSPIDAYDIVMYSSDAVLSGGIRRSATICLFSLEDTEMMNAKTGNWFVENPQRGRSNNSVLLVRGEISRDRFEQIKQSVRQFGEPGFVWAANSEILYNPCCEIGMSGYTDTGHSGWQFCNLSEINIKKVKSKQNFLEAARAASVLGTIQATYTKFDYLGSYSEEIVRREALIGVSMTGMMDNSKISFDPEIQKEGAQVVKQTNARVAKALGINQAARCTTVKPSGSASCVLGSASGIHPHHAKRYFRRVQANKMEFPARHYRSLNPLAVEESVWSNSQSDWVVTFQCEVPEGGIVKNQIDAVTLLKDHVLLTQKNWVEAGTRPELCYYPELRHNVSNTITVLENEWDDVFDFIYDNQEWFAGVSLLPESGDKDYNQAPMCAVFTPLEISRKYGDGSLMASGLIVDGLRAFEDNLWAGCDCVLGMGEPLTVDTLRNKILQDFEYNNEKKWIDEGLSSQSPDSMLQAWLEYNVIRYHEKIDWVRRALQFADRYFSSDYRLMTYCLKDVHNWKKWCDLKREHIEVDWSEVEEIEEYVVDLSTTGAEACSGGACELGELGASISNASK